MKRCQCCGRLIDDAYTLCTACSEYDDMQTFKPRIITNGDRIRAMNNEQLAAFLDHITCCCADSSCESCPIGCKRDEHTGRPLCGSDSIEKWVKRRV